MSLLGSPLEASLRALVALDVMHPKAHSLDELMVFDHVCMHSLDFGGPESLHPALPLRAADLGARRAQVRAGVELLAHRGLATVDVTRAAILVGPGRDSSVVVRSLRSSYLRGYEARAQWLRSSQILGSREQAEALLKTIVSSWSLNNGTADDEY